MLNNSSIMECNNLNSTTDKWFMNPEEDGSADSNKKPWIFCINKSFIHLIINY